MRKARHWLGSALQLSSCDRREREFLGFAKVTTADLQTIGYTGGSFATRDVYRAVEQEFHNETIFDKGLPRRTRTAHFASNAPVLDGEQYASYELRTSSGTKLAAVDQDGYEERETTVPLVRESEWLQVVPRTTYQVTYEAGSTAGVATTTSQEVDSLGNVTSFTDAGSLATDTDDYTATIGYASCGGESLDGEYVVGVPSSIVVKRVGTTLRERSSVIDCDGVPTSVTTTLNDDGERATTTIAYDEYGRIKSVTTPSGGGAPYTLTYGYDEYIGAQVASVTDSFGYVSSAAFDPKLGLLQTRDTDINDQTVTTTYDRFGRPRSVTGPYEQGGSVVTIAYDYHPRRWAPWAHTANYDELHPDDPIETFTITDGLGRVVQTKKDGTIHESIEAKRGEDVRIVSGRVQYDPWGRAVKTWHPVTEPTTAPGAAFRPNPDALVDPTVVRYDTQDRVVSTTLPDGATTAQVYGVEGAGAAAQLRTDVIDAEGKRRVSLTDARGLIREVRELLTVDGTSRVQSTRYDYNPMSELVTVLDAANNPTTVKYDLAGRRTEIDNRDAGKTVLVYDLAGNVVLRQTAALRARNQSIRYVYDRTHLVQVDHPDNEADVVYEWAGKDAAPGQRGRITRILDAGGTLERQYGPLGEVVRETRRLYRHTQTAPTLTELYPPDTQNEGPLANPEGPALETRYRYDTWGRLHELVYPDGEVVRYGYDSGGLVTSATGVKLGVTYPYVSRLEYDEFGQRVFEELGNGIRSHYTYDAETRRLSTLGAGTFQRLVYGYDAVGNVKRLVNDVGEVAANERGGHSEQIFEYDDLHRLVGANGDWTEPGGAHNRYTLTLRYDAIHNLTHKTQEHTVSRHEGGRGVLQRETTYDFAYAYGSSRPHAPTHVGDRAYGYDASGRQVTVTPDTGGPRRTLLWDSEDRIYAIQDGGLAVVDEDGNVVGGHGRTTEFTYDYQGQRITKSGAQGHTAYVNQFYTLRNETIATKHVFVGATRVTSKLVPGSSAEQLPTTTDDLAMYLGRWWQHRAETAWEHSQRTDMNPQYQKPTSMPSPQGLPESNFVYFYHPDHLGSTSFVTDGGGEVYEHVQYFPHGEVWADERSNTERLPYCTRPANPSCTGAAPV